ncbi:MAG TPA: cyclomaltodextrinase N-terminal domain-containing protein, partial [Phnomibacter sp.]|nr:cyclomaltodextrinase N-terminal domain-containing protein [Phnomibacter sp.]
MKKVRYSILLLVVISYSTFVFAQKRQAQPPASIATCYPTHWWPGMQWNNVQVLVKGKTSDFNKQEVSIEYPGVAVQKITPLENGMYYAIDLTIAPDAKPGTVAIKFITPVTGRKKAETHIVEWPLKPRREGKGTRYAQGVTSADLMYLIMPDRFANGDTTNDRIPGMRDQSLNRDTVFNRHGGDLQGIIDHLD